uniref:Signal transducer and activator of transcription 4 n=1 Tax=Scleropages formosus TaxID=113540 RepID=A0A8C9VER1_SCLFO
MSQWKQVQQLDIKFLEQVDYFYDDNFPMEIRQVLAGWIESQDWDMASNHESMASVLFSNLLTQLERQCTQESNFLQRHNLKRIHQQLQVRLGLAGDRMANQWAGWWQGWPIRDLIGCERVQPERNDLSAWPITVQSGHQGLRAAAVAKSCCPSSSSPHHLQEILTKMTDVIKEIDALMSSQLTPELMDWKRRQQIACIGGPLLTGLDQLQYWFTLTAQSLFQMKRQLDKLGELILKVTYDSDPIPLQKPQMEEQSCSLFSSFVVEKQPCMPTHPQKPLIIKTQVQFTTKVRLLVKLPEVDYQLKVLDCCFFILTNNTKVMDVEESSNGCLSVEFRHLQLKERKYINGPKGNEGPLTVTEELHSLSFEAQLSIQGLNIDLETCSLPLVVISNVSQLPGGWASVMWYNLLTDEPKNLSFFSNPPRAGWSQLSEVLSWQFSTFAGRGLTREQLSMLGDKLLGQQSSHGDCQVSWSKFCKENIPGKPFSFWMWLDSILELIKKHLLPVWIDGYIMGFVSKETERALLKEKEPGTFLLRFSESHLGGITFTWVEQAENGEPQSFN